MPVQTSPNSSEWELVLRFENHLDQNGYPREMRMDITDACGGSIHFNGSAEGTSIVGIGCTSSGSQTRGVPASTDL